MSSYFDAAGQRMYDFAGKIFPYNRSLTGEGVRQTLADIASYIGVPFEAESMKIIQIPSGSQVFDWTVPKEWVIREAYVEDEGGNRIIDFKKHNLHARDRERLCICVLREYLRYLRIWQLRYHPERPGDPIHPRFAEAMKALPTVNHFLDCLLGNDLLLAEKTAELLCEEGYIQRLSDYVSSIHGPERRECA